MTLFDLTARSPVEFSTHNTLEVRAESHYDRLLSPLPSEMSQKRRDTYMVRRDRRSHLGKCVLAIPRERIALMQAVDSDPYAAHLRVLVRR